MDLDKHVHGRIGHVCGGYELCVVQPYGYGIRSGGRGEGGKITFNAITTTFTGLHHQGGNPARLQASTDNERRSGNYLGWAWLVTM